MPRVGTSVPGYFVAAAILGLACAHETRAQSIVTIAGGGTGDGRPGTSVGLNSPNGVAVDGMGNSFIADREHHLVRRVDARTGIVTTVAGNGSSSFSGDGGPATTAGLYSPRAVAVDGTGNVFIAESGNHRVRRVEVGTGIITTFVGNGAFGFSGDGGPATAAELNAPSGVAVDAAGNVLVADTNNMRVRRVDARTLVIATVAGNGSISFSGDGGPATAAGLGYFNGVAVDATGNIFIADTDLRRVRRVDARTGIIVTIAGNGSSFFGGDGGPATAAQLGYPWGVALDVSGNVLIADATNHRVRRVDARTGIITTAAGNGSHGLTGDGGPATAAALNYPLGVAVDATGNIFIADTDNGCVRRVDARTGIVTTLAGTGSNGFAGDGGPATSVALNGISDVAVDATGNVFFAEGGFRVRRVDAGTKIITTAAGNGSRGFSGDGGPATAAAVGARAVAVDGMGNLVIGDSGNDRIRRVDVRTGIITTIAGGGPYDFLGDGGPATAAGLYSPWGVAVDARDNVFIADYYHERIRRVDARTGIITTLAGNGSSGFSGDGGLATSAALSAPWGVDVSGTEDVLFADTRNNRIRRVDARTGIIRTVAGGGVQNPPGGFSGDGGPATAAGLLGPYGVAVDGDGNFYIAETAGSRIRRVNAGTGIITTLAGDGSRGFNGDGGPATAARLNQPGGVAVDGGRSVFIADSNSNRIRAVYACRDRLGAFDSSYPNDGSAAVVGGLALSWSDADSAFRYDVLVDTEFPPKKVLQKDVTGQGVQLSGLEPGRDLLLADPRQGGSVLPGPSNGRRGIKRFTTTTPCASPLTTALQIPSVSGTTATLAFSPVPGAASYDIYLGAGGVAPLVASGLTTNTYTATGLQPGTTYRWRVAAHAACNPDLVSSSPESTFAVPGSCRSPSAVRGHGSSAGSRWSRFFFRPELASRIRRLVLRRLSRDGLRPSALRLGSHGDGSPRLSRPRQELLPAGRGSRFL